MKAITLLTGLLMTATALTSQADEIKRIALPNSNFPISLAVSVPAQTELLFVSGLLADLHDPKAPKDSFAAYGDTATQTTSILNKLKSVLQSQGLDLGDVVQLRVFLVGDPAKGNKLDFAGLQEGYTPFFGSTAQPNKPARTAIQVVALPLPGGLVEIEAVAARKK
ncbi:RidA family protein [Pseudomonas nunensis]|uniref:RidA family protein n=1 Tax=Pseudomonas nunensis TaxID=2961896 RepID=UPI0025AF518E|nr:RidA family protein [Pseudomonas nunensis]MDN3222400.1 RidA family protein [Pseudomonas nunensis]